MNVMLCDVFSLLLEVFYKVRHEENTISTIPENISAISAHPDMVLVGEDEVTLTELTIPHNSMESLSPNQKSKIGKKKPIGKP